MKDRIATYPGRVKATKVAGTEDTFDITRADSPTQVGTPLRESTLMSDETAALVGLGEDDTPDQMLAILAKRQATNTKDIEYNAREIQGLSDQMDLIFSGDADIGGGVGKSMFKEYQNIGAFVGGSEPVRMGQTYSEVFNGGGLPDVASRSSTTWPVLNKGSSGALGSYSHAEGRSTMAIGDDSHAEGYNSWAINAHSHAEGTNCAAIGMYSHAEGFDCATGLYDDAAEAAQVDGAFSLGGMYAHAEGNTTLALNNAAHSEGAWTIASGQFSHAEGSSTEARSYESHAEGFDTIANSRAAHAGGHCNKEMEVGDIMNTVGDAFVIGNGTDHTKRSNAFRVTYSGKVYGKGDFNSSGADYAEYFEWADGNPDNEDRVGRFVTMDGTKIALASPGDYILGIVSGQPCIIGNSDEDWTKRWVQDEYGRFIKEYLEEEEVQIKNTPKTETERHKLLSTPNVSYKNGKFFQKTSKVVTDPDKVTDSWRYKENPDYDSTQKYVERKDRKEWDAVGMVGVLAVDDDGTCQVNGFCKVSDNGTATKASKYVHGETYRVIERVTENVVKIVLK